jgi:hypothetical protein
MDGEVVHPLLRLLDEGVAVDLPGELLRHATHLLQRLVDGNRPDRHRRVAEDPLARLVDVLPRREVHHRVGAPEGRPAQLLHLLLDGGGDGRVPDVGVDLHLEAAADQHRLQLRVVDVGGEDGAAARDLAAHELRVHPLAEGGELHLRGDLAAAGVVHLRDPAGAAQGGAPQRLRHLHRGASLYGSVRALHRLHRAAFRDPPAPQLRQPLAHVHTQRAAGVVHPQRRLAAGEGDLAHRNTDAVPPLDVHLAGGGEGGAVVTAGGRLLLGALDHGTAPSHCGGGRGAAGRGAQKKRATSAGGWRVGTAAGQAGSADPLTSRRAPSAGLIRIRFQGTFSISAMAEIPLAAMLSG